MLKSQSETGKLLGSGGFQDEAGDCSVLIRSQQAHETTFTHDKYIKTACLIYHMQDF